MEYDGVNGHERLGKDAHGRLDGEFGHEDFDSGAHGCFGCESRP